MDLFRGYKDDFEEAANEAEGAIGALHGLSGDDLRRKQSEIESALQEANQVIASMNVAIPNATNKGHAQEVIDKCRSRHAELKKRFKTALETAQGKNDRLSLLGGTDQESLASVQARTSVLTDTDALRKGEDDLRQINQRVNQIGSQGAETLDTMAGQRQRMDGQRSRLDGIRMKLRDSERLIRAVATRMSVNDFMKIGIMILIVILIIVVIYLRWIRKNIKHATPSGPIITPHMPVSPTPEEVVDPNNLF